MYIPHKPSLELIQELATSVISTPGLLGIHAEYAIPSSSFPVNYTESSALSCIITQGRIAMMDLQLLFVFMVSGQAEPYPSCHVLRPSVSFMLFFTFFPIKLSQERLLLYYYVT